MDLAQLSIFSKAAVKHLCNDFSFPHSLLKIVLILVNVFGESHVHSIPDSLLKIVLILVNVFGESHVHSIPENCFDIDQRVWREPCALHSILTHY